MTIYSCDIEANGLLDTVDKIHCLSFKELGCAENTVIDISFFFTNVVKDGDTLVWHNGFGYDLPVLEKLGVISGYKLAGSGATTTISLPDGTVKHIQLIDTLALSREYWPDNPRGHDLASWAKFLGTYKPEIEDWHNLPIEDYIERCENDVITTEKVFLYLCEKLGIKL